MKLLGSKDITRKLNEIAEDLATDVLRQAAQNGADVYQLRMSQNAPRGDDPPHVADNIGINEIESHAKRTVTMAIGPVTGFSYAWHQEYGTKFHAAQAFVRPTMDVYSGEAEDEVAQTVREYIEDL